MSELYKETYFCSGGCHCGRVRFEVCVPRQLTVHRCNCSICDMTGFLHVIVAADDFKLFADSEDLSEYRFNTGTARHLFCKSCGVKSFYRPRSHPDGYSVNLNCVELPEEVEVILVDFDGKHWRRNVARISE